MAAKHEAVENVDYEAQRVERARTRFRKMHGRDPVQIPVNMVTTIDTIEESVDGEPKSIEEAAYSAIGRQLTDSEGPRSYEFSFVIPVSEMVKSDFHPEGFKDGQEPPADLTHTITVNVH